MIRAHIGSLAAAASIVWAAAAMAAPADIQSGSYGVEPYHTRVQFALDHMGLSEWFGDFSGVAGTLLLDAQAPANSKVDISIPVQSISTTNAKLDDELRSKDWLDAGTYPTIRFVSSSVVPTGNGHARILGTLTLHGVSHPVELQAQLHGAGTNVIDKAYTVGFDATAHILRSDFGVKTYLPLIGDSIDIRISVAFERKPA